MSLSFLKVSKLDVKLGLRMLARYPGLSLVSVIGMAVAIAIVTGYASFFAAMLEDELPFPGGDRIIAVRYDEIRGGDEGAAVRDLLTWREQLKSTERLAAFRTRSRNVSRDQGRTQVQAIVAITANGFHMPRVAPLLGRGLLQEDEQPGAPNVVVIGYDEWQRLFAGDADVVGKTLRIAGDVHTVVGVMPQGFLFPVQDQYWVPLRIDAADHASTDLSLNVFGPLASGATIERARAEAEAIGKRMAAASPEIYDNLRVQVIPFTHSFTGVDGPEVQMQVRAMQALISLLLVIVAINIAVLVYARTATRIGELAVRSALGASRRRITTQLFIEAAVLAGAAAVVGLTITHLGLEFLTDGLANSQESRLPFWIDFRLSPALVGFVVLLALLASAIIGILPALKVTGKQLDALKEYGARGAGLRLGKTWTALIVLQVAFAVAALPPAMNHAVQTMGFSLRSPVPLAHDVLRARLMLPDSTADAEAVVRRLEADPRVAGVTFASSFAGEGPGARVETEGEEFIVQSNRVATDFFETLDVPLIAGRAFTAADARDSATAVIVDDVFAAELGGTSAIGRRIRYASSDPEVEPGPWFEIIGIVRSFAEGFGKQELGGPDPRMFHASAAVTPVTSALAIRVDGNAADVARDVPDLTSSVDPRVNVTRLETYAERYASEQNGYQLIAVGVTAVMLSVLLLSAAGIYAMMSFTVARRRREIGIRAALGAQPRRVLAGIFGRAGLQLGVGVGLGLALAMTIEIASPGMVLGGKGALLVPAVVAVIVTVGMLAALGPARRGLAVQPTEVLRDS